MIHLARVSVWEGDSPDGGKPPVFSGTSRAARVFLGIRAYASSPCVEALVFILFSLFHTLVGSFSSSIEHSYKTKHMRLN